MDVLWIFMFKDLITFKMPDQVGHDLCSLVGHDDVR